MCVHKWCFILSNILDNLSIAFSPKEKNEYKAGVFDSEVSDR